MAYYHGINPHLVVPCQPISLVGGPHDLEDTAVSYILFAGQVHNLVKRLPAIITADGIALLVAHMIIGGDEDADGIGIYSHI